MTQNKGALLRERYFEQFSRQPGHDDLTQGVLFFCPICRRPFDRNALDPKNLQLTLAHIISKVLGGSWMTLTCVRCNNDVGGTQLEPDLVASLQFLDWSQGAGEISVRMGDSGKVRALWSRSPAENKMSFQITTPMESPNVEKLRCQAADSVENPQPMRLKIPLFRGNRCWAAVFQSAYLLLFRYFGYDFARHPNYQPIREQVIRPDERVLTENIYILEQDAAVQILGGRQAAIIFVREPIRSVLAVLRYRSPAGIDQVLAVVLPGLDEPLPPKLDVRSFSGEIVPYEPELMAEQQGFFWWSWHHWLHEHG